MNLVYSTNNNNDIVYINHFKRLCPIIYICQSFLNNYSITVNVTNIILKNTYNVNISILKKDLNAKCLELIMFLMMNLYIVSKYCTLINCDIVL